MKNSLKNIVQKIYNYPVNSPQRINKFQMQIRDYEWEAIEKFIEKGKFLDVGCGAGYSMYKAQLIGCEVFGIDPEPREHGVGRKDSDFIIPIENIIQGFSEQIPFSNEEFNTVFCSHVLEHVTDLPQSLKEIARVTKKDGIIILGVPTSTMAWINWISEFIFITHHKFVNIFFKKFITTGNTHWWELFIPVSHSYPLAKTSWYDIFNYRTKVWEKKIQNHIEIQQVIKPCLYPSPDYRQLFRMRKNVKYSSSVFFVCKK